MFSRHCFKENCKNKLCATCDCEENVFFCQEHALEHTLKPSPIRHQCIQKYFRPAEEVKQIVIQKLVENKNDIKKYRKEAIERANKVINNLKTTFGKYLDQISEVDKRCSKMIEGFLNEEEFLDIANKDDMESVLKLDVQKAKIKMLGWDTNCCCLDYKGINTAISKCYEIPFNSFTSFGGVVEDEIESNELSFFIHNTSNFSTINLDNFQVSSTDTLSTQENIHHYASCCILPDKTYFYCINEGKNSGMAFTIDNNKNVKQLQKLKVNSYSDTIFYNNFIYILGGYNKIADRYDFKQNLWQSIGPLPQGLDYTSSCSALFEDLILITGYYLQKIISYSINQNNYKDIPNLVLDNNREKLMLRGNNRIYLFEKGTRIFESAENNISKWVHIGSNAIPNNTHLQSVVVRFKGILYFVVPDSQLWKFDLSSKKASLVKVLK